jgi:hypothetical protein
MPEPRDTLAYQVWAHAPLYATTEPRTVDCLPVSSAMVGRVTMRRTARLAGALPRGRDLSDSRQTATPICMQDHARNFNALRIRGGGLG